MDLITLDLISLAVISLELIYQDLISLDLISLVLISLPYSLGESDQLLLLLLLFIGHSVLSVAFYENELIFGDKMLYIYVTCSLL